VFREEERQGAGQRRCRGRLEVAVRAPLLRLLLVADGDVVMAALAPEEGLVAVPAEEAVVSGKT
jgi:hypothetical protein